MQQTHDFHTIRMFICECVMESAALVLCTYNAQLPFGRRHEATVIQPCERSLHLRSLQCCAAGQEQIHQPQKGTVSTVSAANASTYSNTRVMGHGLLANSRSSAADDMRAIWKCFNLQFSRQNNVMPSAKKKAINQEEG